MPFELDGGLDLLPSHRTYAVDSRCAVDSSHDSRRNSCFFAKRHPTTIAHPLATLM